MGPTKSSRHELLSARSAALTFIFFACVCSGRRVQTAFTPASTGGQTQWKFQGARSSATGPRAILDKSLSPVAHAWQGGTRRQAAAAFVSALALMGNPFESSALVDMATPIEVIQQQERTIEDLFVRATPSVVYIDTFTKGRDRFTMNEVQMPQGTGSGIVWDKAGHIVTNYHVIKDATSAKVTVTRPGQKPKKYDANLVGYDPDKDIAVLDIGAEGQELTPISVGESRGLRVGATALAIGNPFGFDHSLTVGVVSGLGREITAVSGRPLTNVIQTDASVNPGNSGGVLLDSSGRLIGMNTAIYSPSGTSSGVGFAVPVDTVKQQVATIIRDGRVTRTTIGINYVPGDQARALGVARGVLVLDVKPGSSPAKAGLRGTSRLPSGDINFGDVIVKVDDREVNDESDLFKALEGKKPGDKITLLVGRLEQQQFGGASEVEIPLTVELTKVVAT